MFGGGKGREGGERGGRVGREEKTRRGVEGGRGLPEKRNLIFFVFFGGFSFA